MFPPEPCTMHMTFIVNVVPKNEQSSYNFQKPHHLSIRIKPKKDMEHILKSLLRCNIHKVPISCYYFQDITSKRESPFCSTSPASNQGTFQISKQQHNKKNQKSKKLLSNGTHPQGQIKLRLANFW